MRTGQRIEADDTVASLTIATLTVAALTVASLAVAALTISTLTISTLTIAALASAILRDARLDQCDRLAIDHAHFYVSQRHASVCPLAHCHKYVCQTGIKVKPIRERRRCVICGLKHSEILRTGKAFPDGHHLGVGGCRMRSNRSQIDRLDQQSRCAEVQSEEHDDGADDSVDGPDGSVIWLIALRLSHQIPFLN